MLSATITCIEHQLADTDRKGRLVGKYKYGGSTVSETTADNKKKLAAPAHRPSNDEVGPDVDRTVILAHMDKRQQYN